MKYKKILNTDLNVSSISLGSALFGSSIARDEAFKLMDVFKAQGGNFLDTAHIYADWLPVEKSISEKTIGEWLRLNKNRNQMVIATKGAHPDFSHMEIARLSKKDVTSDLEGSLSALQTDYIDLYWLHRDDEDRPVSEILEYLNEFVKSGKILNFGCSNWKSYRIAEALDYAKVNGLKSFVGNQNMWNYAVPNKEDFQDKSLVVMDEEAKTIHLRSGMAAIPFSSQANGFFTKLDDNNLSDEIKKLYYSEENVFRYKRAKKVAIDLNINISDVVLGYLISQPFVTVPVVGCRTKAQLEDSLKAQDLKFSCDILRYLENGV